MQRHSCHSIKKSQNIAKRPNIFFKAKQEIKMPKSSYLAAKKPSYQPCIYLEIVLSIKSTNQKHGGFDVTVSLFSWGHPLTTAHP